MAAKTSNGTGGGLWSAGSTWAGGVVPVSGTDTVSIAAGDTVTIDSAAMSGGQLIIGSDPGTGGTAALTIGTSAQAATTTVLVNTGVVVRLRGDLTITGQNLSGGHFSILSLSQGSSLIFDPPAAATYKYNLNYLCKILCNGATNTGTWPDTPGGNHVIVKTDLTRGGNNCIPVILGGVPNTANIWGGFTFCQFAEFSNFGNATTAGFMPYPQVGTFGYATEPLTCQNCTFTGCSYYALCEPSDATGWHGDFLFDNNIFTSSVATTQFAVTFCAGFAVRNPISSETKRVTGCSFDGPVIFDGTPSGFAWTGNVFAGGISKGNTPAWANDTQFNTNLAVQTTQVNWSLNPVKNCYWVMNNGATGLNILKAAGSSSITGCVFEQSSGNGSGPSNGNILIVPTGNAVTCKLNLVLPAPGDSKSPGTLMDTGGFTGHVLEHNLVWGPSLFTPGVAVGIGGAATLGSVASCRANIVYGFSAGTVTAATESTGSTFTTDAVSVATNNCFVNGQSGTIHWGSGPTTQTGVIGYNSLAISTNSPYPNAQLGNGDLTAQNPNFTATGAGNWRNLARWNAAVNGGAATFAAALLALQANPGLLTAVGGDATKGALYWVKAGYVPTNTALNAATFAGDATTTDANGNPLGGAIGPLGFPISFMPWIFGDQIESNGGG